MSAPSRVLLLTRDGCHLWVEAEAVVRDTCEALGVAWQRVDVDTVDALRARYTDHVPVTFVDRKLHGYWFVDPARLRDQLLPEAGLDTSTEWILGQL